MANAPFQDGFRFENGVIFQPAMFGLYTEVYHKMQWKTNMATENPPFLCCNKKCCSIGMLVFKCNQPDNTKNMFFFAEAAIFQLHLGIFRLQSSLRFKATHAGERVPGNSHFEPIQQKLNGTKYQRTPKFSNLLYSDVALLDTQGFFGVRFS